MMKKILLSPIVFKPCSDFTQELRHLGTLELLPGTLSPINNN